MTASLSSLTKTTTAKTTLRDSRNAAATCATLPNEVTIESGSKLPMDRRYYLGVANCETTTAAAPTTTSGLIERRLQATTKNEHD